MFVESDSTDDDYEADEEDTQEVGYASEPSANILRVSFQCFKSLCQVIQSMKST